MTNTRITSALFIAMLFPAVVARAGEPFLITATTTSGTPASVSTGGSNLPNLITNVIKSESIFSSLQNRNTSATVRYGGLNDAIVVSKNSTNTSATLTLPSIGFTKTFTGSSESDLNSQIRKFAEKNGADIYGQFIRSINQSTDIGVTDGNPLAATAIFADQAYRQFGLEPAPFAAGTDPVNPLDQVATPNIRLDFNGGYSHSDSSSSYFAGGDFSLGFKFGDRVGLVFDTPFEYRNVQGADVYDIAEEVSLPIVLRKAGGNFSLGWMLTPTFTAGGAGSVDLAAGGVFLGGGITSSLSYQIAGFVVTLADSFQYFHGFPITIGAYQFDTNLDQEVLKNGLKLSKFFGNNFFLDASFTYTNFLQRADIREYWSPAAGLGFRFNSSAGLRVGYSGDFSHDFVAHGGELQLYFNY